MGQVPLIINQLQALGFTACRRRAIQDFEELDVARAGQSMPLNF
jgi:hypothetical protein